MLARVLLGILAVALSAAPAAGAATVKVTGGSILTIVAARGEANALALDGSGTDVTVRAPLVPVRLDPSVRRAILRGERVVVRATITQAS